MNSAKLACAMEDFAEARPIFLLLCLYLFSSQSPDVDTGLAVGQPCVVSSQCQSKSCSGTVCTGADCTTLTCPSPSKCNSNIYSPDPPKCQLYTSDCPANQFANQTSLTCLQQKPAGSFCVNSDECLSQNCVSNNCSAYVSGQIPQNERCDYSGCQAPYQCNGTHCTTAPTFGEACNAENLYCGPGFACVGGTCTNSTTYGMPCKLTNTGEPGGNCSTDARETCQCGSSNVGVCLTGDNRPFSQEGISVLSFIATVSRKCGLNGTDPASGYANAGCPDFSRTPSPWAISASWPTLSAQCKYELFFSPSPFMLIELPFRSFMTTFSCCFGCDLDTLNALVASTGNLVRLLLLGCTSCWF